MILFESIPEWFGVSTAIPLWNAHFNIDHHTCSYYVLEVVLTEARSSTSFQIVARALAEGSAIICIAVFNVSVLPCVYLSL